MKEQLFTVETVQQFPPRSPGWNFFNPFTCIGLHASVLAQPPVKWNPSCLLSFVFFVTLPVMFVMAESCTLLYQSNLEKEKKSLRALGLGCEKLGVLICCARYI